MSQFPGPPQGPPPTPSYPPQPPAGYAPPAQQQLPVPPPAYPQQPAPYAQQPMTYAPAPAPVRRRNVWRTFFKVRVVVVLVVLVIGGIAAAVRAYNGAAHGQTSDGVIVAGDCVNETATQVIRVDCTGSHTGKVSSVLSPGSTGTCPAAEESVGLKDPSSGQDVGTACIDSTDHS